MKSLKFVGSSQDDLSGFPLEAKLADAIHILHAFQKKTQRTRREDIELARRRYLQIGG